MPVQPQYIKPSEPTPEPQGITQEEYNKQLAEYEKNIAEYESANAVAIAEYNKQLEKQKADEQLYFNELASYEKQLAEQKAAEIEYNKQLAEYNKSKAEYDSKMLEYQRQVNEANDWEQAKKLVFKGKGYAAQGDNSTEGKITSTWYKVKYLQEHGYISGEEMGEIYRDQKLTESRLKDELEQYQSELKKYEKLGYQGMTTKEGIVFTLVEPTKPKSILEPLTISKPINTISPVLAPTGLLEKTQYKLNQLRSVSPTTSILGGYGQQLKGAGIGVASSVLGSAMFFKNLATKPKQTISDSIIGLKNVATKFTTTGFPEVSEMIKREPGFVTGYVTAEIVGPYASKKVVSKSSDFFRTIGMKEIPAEKVIAPEYFAGQKYPSVKKGQSAGELLKEFQPFFEYETKPGGFTASGKSFSKITLVESGTSEFSGLYQAPKVSPTFLRISGESDDLKLFSLNPFETLRPTVARVTPDEIKLAPGVKSSSLVDPSKSKINKLKTFFNEKAEKGKSYLPYIKDEKEIILTAGTPIQRVRSNYYFKFEGRKVPIFEYETIGTKSTPKKILSTKDIEKVSESGRIKQSSLLTSSDIVRFKSPSSIKETKVSSINIEPSKIISKPSSVLVSKPTTSSQTNFKSKVSNYITPKSEEYYIKPLSSKSYIKPLKSSVSVISKSKPYYSTPKFTGFSYNKIPSSIITPKQSYTKIPKTSISFSPPSYSRSYETPRYIIPKSPPTSRPPKSPPVNIRDYDFTRSKQKKQGSDFTKSYDVFVRKKGKIEKVGSGLTYGKALKVGTETSKSSTIQTFGLKEAGYTKERDINFKLPSLFTTPKKQKTFITGNTFVEKRGKTLTERKEVSDILKSKRRKSNSILF